MTTGMLWPVKCAIFSLQVHWNTIQIRERHPQAVSGSYRMFELQRAMGNGCVHNMIITTGEQTGEMWHGTFRKFSTAKKAQALHPFIYTAHSLVLYSSLARWGTGVLKQRGVGYAHYWRSLADRVSAVLLWSERGEGRLDSVAEIPKQCSFWNGSLLTYLPHTLSYSVIF